LANQRPEIGVFNYSGFAIPRVFFNFAGIVNSMPLMTDLEAVWIEI
jgi:hypothetical protein